MNKLALALITLISLPAAAAIQVNQNQALVVPAGVTGTANATALAASFWVKVTAFPTGTCPTCPYGNDTSSVVLYAPGTIEGQGGAQPRIGVSIKEVNPTAIRNKKGQIIGYTPDTTHGNVLIQASTGYDIATFETTTKPLVLNTWQHVAAQVDWNTLTAKVWVNGVLSTGAVNIPVFSQTGAEPSAASVLASTGTASFGTTCTYAFEDARVYARALTNADVAAIQATPGLDAVTDYVVRHKANEATSGAVVSVTDYGVNACHAGPIGTPSYVVGIIQ